MQTPEESQFCYDSDLEVPQDHVTGRNVGTLWDRGDIASGKRRRIDVASPGTVDDIGYAAGTTSVQMYPYATSSVYDWPYADTSWLPQTYMGDEGSKAIPDQPLDHSAFPVPQQHFNPNYDRFEITSSQQHQWPQNLTDSCELKCCLSSRDFLTYTGIRRRSASVSGASSIPSGKRYDI